MPIGAYICFVFEQTRDFIVAFNWILRIFPSFCLGHGIIFIGSDAIISAFAGEEDTYPPFSLDSAGADILFMGILSVLYIVILILLEWRESNPYLRKLMQVGDVPKGDFTPDQDVEY